MCLTQDPKIFIATKAVVNESSLLDSKLPLCLGLHFGSQSGCD